MNIRVFFALFLMLLACGEEESEIDNKEPLSKTECNQEGNFCIKVTTFNIAVGQLASPEVIANELKKINQDILVLTECPILIDQQSEEDEFVKRIATVLDMPYWEIGEISAGNHWKEWGTDISGKYHGKLKAVLSKTPLSQGQDFLLNGRGWTNASVFKTSTELEGKTFDIYAVHVPGSGNNVEGSAHEDLVDRFISKQENKNVLILGDFNDEPADATLQYIINQGYQVHWSDLEDVDDRLDPYEPGMIDNILYKVSSEAKATDGFSIYPNPRISDHPYVWGKLVLPK